MEIALITSTSIRLKGKSTTVVIDPPAEKSKIQADVVILLHPESSYGEVEESRLTISGPGEYEVGGVKITGNKVAGHAAYYLTLDSVTMLIALAGSLKAKENLRDVDVVVIHADTLVDQSVLATITSGAAVFYGPQAQENVKALEKDIQPINKYVTTKDKLPAEMEVVQLA